VSFIEGAPNPSPPPGSVHMAYLLGRISRSLDLSGVLYDPLGLDISPYAPLLTPAACAYRVRGDHL